MKVQRNRVVEFDYVLRNDAGEVLGSTEGGEAVSYLHGHGQIVPGLERALDGADEGDTVQVTLKPVDAYGEHDPNKVFRVPREQIPSHIPLRPGVELIADDGMGHAVPLRVLEVTGDEVILDANHPLAGETLKFTVTVRHVRDASAEELLHGHVHEERTGK